jgi:integrase
MYNRLKEYCKIKVCVPFLTNRLGKVKGGTVDRELVAIRAMFNQAKKWNKFNGDNPVSKAGLIRVNDQIERILTDEEEKRLLNASSETLRPIIICALYTGMRKGEIISLKWENVDLTNDVITLNHETTKNKKTRRIPINVLLKKLLITL